jgi:dTDP-glucose 4,6-dehydratase
MVTGGLGFIGSNFINQIHRFNEIEKIVNVDCLTYAGSTDNIGKNIQNDSRYLWLNLNIRDAGVINAAIKKHAVTHIVHFAAESHVDRSISKPDAFIETNVRGTFNLLEACRNNTVKKFIHISTDEVYGSVECGASGERDSLNPSSPYSASKASADMLCLAYHKTYGIQSVIARCANNYGPNQYPEKLIPLAIGKAMKGERIPIYGNGSNIRDWIHVTDHCHAIWLVLSDGVPGEIYNVSGGNLISNLALVNLLCEMCGAEKSLVEFVKDRPGHDLRYLVNDLKIKSELGWQPAVLFYRGLMATVDFYRKKFSTDLYTSGWRT